MITISSYPDSNRGLWITSYMKNIYIKVHSDNHYTIRANIPTRYHNIFKLENIETIMLRGRGFEPLPHYENRS